MDACCRPTAKSNGVAKTGRKNIHFTRAQKMRNLLANRIECCVIDF